MFEVSFISFISLSSQEVIIFSKLKRVLSLNFSSLELYQDTLLISHNSIFDNIFFDIGVFNFSS